jgi:hypothetical protein
MTREELIREENRRIRMLRISSDLLIQVIMTRRLPFSEVDGMIRGVKELAMKLFPGKEDVFDLVYLPRFRRAMREAGMLDSGVRLTFAKPAKEPIQDGDESILPLRTD